MAANIAPKSLDEVYYELDEIEEKIRVIVERNTRQNSQIYDASLVLWGAANRTISQCRGFSSMLRDRNFTCSSAILRMQLDTVLRLYGGLLFGHIGDYSKKMMAGERVSDLKAHNGKRLFDSFLMKKIAKQQPWIATVYERSSGSIHFSNRHVILAMSDLEDDGKIRLQIGPSDKHVKEEFFLELGQAFLHTTILVIQMIEEWYAQLPTASPSITPQEI